MALAFLGAVVATDAGRLGEDGTGAIRVAPELLGVLNDARITGCTHEVVIEAADLETNGRVAFEWHPATGELSFAADTRKTEFKFPADAPAQALAPAMQSCGSR